MSNLVCPISPKRIDGNVSRLTVFISQVVFLCLYIATYNPLFLFITSIDVAVRSFMDPKYSLIRMLSAFVLSIANVEPKMIGLAPKIFASRLGFICAVLAAVLGFFGFHFASIAVAGLFVVLSTMDAVFKFCVGCLIYHYIVFPLSQRSALR